ncbi:hypothetical protein HOU00_gp298 [Caulobacter phage CcrPW]|uniref:Uncharacterized protein n=1 Tax=Caulobacter phage CcrPW TaxID=2283271 RepID=A0A385EDC3_9CAUD|nr:hypothetical protein HOU00_gp298 [Caulobacter phage CcrPW]AXQ68827.1 hypothetical protein CcrPW_gp288 [Caulobacter phage CcrPW]
MSRRSSSSSNVALWLGGAVILLVLGVIVYAIADRAGTPTKSGLARIDEIRFRPAYTSTSGSGSEKKTKHHQAEWKVDVVTLEGRDTVTRTWSPPAWMAEDGFVKASYSVGRFSHSVSISKLEPIK